MSSRTFKWVIAGVIAAFLLILVASCHQQPIYAQQGYAQPAVVGQAPVIVQQQPVYVGGSHDGFFTGMLAGHLLSGGGGYGSHTTTIIHAAPAAAYHAPIAAPTYTPRPSFTTNARGVSTSISRSGGISVRSGRRR